MYACSVGGLVQHGSISCIFLTKDDNAAIFCSSLRCLPAAVFCVYVWNIKLSYHWWKGTWFMV